MSFKNRSNIGIVSRRTTVLNENPGAFTPKTQRRNLSVLHPHETIRTIHDPFIVGREDKGGSGVLVDVPHQVQDAFTRPPIVAALAGMIHEMPVPLVIDHFGHMRAERGTVQPGFSDLMRMIESGRAYVKLSAAQRVSSQPDCADAALLAQALINANPERVLWGSDWPHPGGRPGAARNAAVIEPFNDVDDGMALNRAARWAGSAERIAKLLVENPARLYDF